MSEKSKSSSLVVAAKQTLETIKEGAKPTAVGLVLTAGGAVAAEVGGGIAKHFVQPVEDFAAQGPMQEALVDVGAGILIDAAVLTGVALWKGPKVAGPLAVPLLIGTALVAFLDVAKPVLNAIVDGVFGLFGITSAAPEVIDGQLAEPKPKGIGPAGLWTQTVAADQLRLGAPGGAYAPDAPNRYAPGGLTFGEANTRNQLPVAATAFGA